MAPLVVVSLLLVPATTSVPTAAGTPDVEDTGAFGTLGQTVADVQGPVDELVTPTSGAPSFVLDGDVLRLELRSTPDQPLPHVLLRPSFGPGPTVQAPVEQVGDPTASERWEGPYARSVVPLDVRVPDGTPAGLYDVEVSEVDEQPRAVSVLDAWPETLELVLLADTQTGDPRAVADGFEGSTGIDPLAPHETDPGDVHADPGPLSRSLNRTFGINVTELSISPEDRWGAYRAAIDQINALEPHLVLFSGDLNFGQLAPGSWHVEYEEAWALLNGRQGIDGTDYEGIHAPTLLSPGNHDGYVANGEDGLAFWSAYFGPPAYAVEMGERTFVSINTYDWSELDRFGISYAVSAWGGQVRDAQLTWLRTTLCEANDGTPTEDEAAIAGVGCSGATDRPVITFSHHSPSWVQDPWTSQYGGACETAPCQGTPVAEQFTRGFVSFTTTGQGWTGENRLEVRDTLRSFEIDLHAAGHTHRDRLARDLGDGTIVETPQQEREDLDPRKLHQVTRDGAVSVPDQGWARDQLRNASGPLYVETTTAASDTDQYFGYRPVTWHPSEAAFPEDALGIAPFETGVELTAEDVERITRVPEHWNASHAELGLFSTPTFHEVDASPP